MLRAGDRFERWSVLLFTMGLPRPLRLPLRQRALGRLELARARRAALLIVGHPKSGNTWLRSMISRLYQRRYGLPSDFVVKTDELHRRDPRIPPILATNAHYSYEAVVGERLAACAPRAELHDKPVVLLARHPCDVAVSWYFQFTRRQSEYKNELINHSLEQPVDRTTISMWDFVRHRELGLPFLVEFLNTWERNMSRIGRSLVVRYEDLRVDPGAWLRRVMDLMGAAFDDREIRDAVAYTSFENQRRLEVAGHFRRGGLALRRARDPDTLKTRRGVVGGYRDYFSPDQIAELDALVAERLSPGFGYGPPPAPERAASIRSSQRVV
jgi:hypothetical protein